MKELPASQEHDLVRGILSVLALDKGVRTYARLLLNYSEEEMLDMESAATET